MIRTNVLTKFKDAKTMTFNLFIQELFYFNITITRPVTMNPTKFKGFPNNYNQSYC